MFVAIPVVKGRESYRGMVRATAKHKSPETFVRRSDALKGLKGESVNVYETDGKPGSRMQRVLSGVTV
jgi:hypothetical protein